MCECVIVNGMYHKVKAYILVCACEREEGHPLDTHSFYHLTHSDSCCWGKRRNGSNTTPPNGASHSKQPQFNRERNISFLPFNSACSSRAKRDPDRGQLTHALPHLPHPRYHWDGDYERKEDAGFGSLWLQCSDATANDTFFMHTPWVHKQDNTSLGSKNTAVHIMNHIFWIKNMHPSYKVIQQEVCYTCYPLAFPLISMADARLAMDPLEVCDL